MTCTTCAIDGREGVCSSGAAPGILLRRVHAAMQLPSRRLPATKAGGVLTHYKLSEGISASAHTRWVKRLGRPCLRIASHLLLYIRVV